MPISENNEKTCMEIFVFNFNLSISSIDHGSNIFGCRCVDALFDAVCHRGTKGFGRHDRLFVGWIQHFQYLRWVCPLFRVI